MSSSESNVEAYGTRDDITTALDSLNQGDLVEVDYAGEWTRVRKNTNGVVILDTSTADDSSSLQKASVFSKPVLVNGTNVEEIHVLGVLRQPTTN